MTEYAMPCAMRDSRPGGLTCKARLVLGGLLMLPVQARPRRSCESEARLAGKDPRDTPVGAQ